MKTNVSYVEKKMFVNEDKRTVACNLKSCIRIPEKYDFMLYEETSFTDFLRANPNIVPDYDSDVLYVTTIGKAKCSEDDDFNQAVGEMIALTKAQAMVFSLANTIFVEMLKAITKLYVGDLKSLIASNATSWSKCKDHVNDIYNDYKGFMKNN